jgi:hypothetical protein
MKKVIYFFLILTILIFLFNTKILSYFLSNKISNWTEYNSEINISKLNFLEGKLIIDKIQIGKDKNFNSKIFEANLIVIDLDLKSLFSNLVIINKLIISKPVFYFDINDQNNNQNLNKKNIIENMNLVENSSKIYPLKKKDKNFLISYLKIENSKAKINYKKKNKDLNISLSNISLSNVGNAGIEKGKSFQHYKDIIKLILSDIFFKIPDFELRELIKKNYKIG